MTRKKNKKDRPKKWPRPGSSVSSPVEALQLASSVTDVQTLPAALPPAAEDVGREGQLEPYDEYLLDRARTQWQFGDWEPLRALTLDRLAHHPQRARLALLAAAGQAQCGALEDAAASVRQARVWGADRQQAARVLVSGVYNALGKAAAVAGQSERALGHFEQALVSGTPGGAVRLLTQARTGEQLSQLGLPIPKGYLKVGAGETAMPAKLPPLSQSIEAITDTLKQQKAELDTQLKQQAKELTRVRDSLSKAVKTEITNATKQLEAFFGIQSYFESGQVIGELHGWPISPDLGLYLIQQLEAKVYDLVIEFGSGTSTQLIAKTLATIAQRQPTRPKPFQVAFEHLERFHQKSLSVLQQSGLAEAVALYHTPLQPYTGPDGAAYSYYDCEPALQALAKASNKPTSVILALVDGPPKSTGIHARYPALPLLLQHFPEAQIDLILDDYNRPEEKEMANKWFNDLETLRINFERIEEPLDKGACKLSIAARNKQA